MSKKPLAIVMTIFVAVVLGALAGAADLDTEQIDVVLEKAAGGGVLGGDDFEIIDDFVEDAIEQMILTEDLSESVDIRAQIVARSRRGMAGQYAVSFATSAAKHLTAAFDGLDKWDVGLRKNQAQRNIIVLAARIRSVELARLGLRAIDSDDLAVRYWAVIGVTNESVIAQLASQGTGDAELATEIVTRLKAMAQGQAQPEIQFLIAAFADKLGGNDGIGMLLAVSQARARVYESWTVEYELVDAEILKCLGRAIPLADTAQDKTDLSRSFAQLYSYAIQRYIAGAGILDEADMVQLASVIVDVEQNAVGKLLDTRQFAIKDAVEKKKPDVLQREHDFLLGSATRTGSLLEKLKFNYGTNATGEAIVWPKQLPGPPKKPADNVEVND
jgi:hypothetical protein